MRVYQDNSSLFGLSSETKTATGKLGQANVFFLLSIWLIVVCSGIFYLIEYSYTTNSHAELGNQQWPSTSTIENAAGQNHILIFLHPKCSCSHATLNELQKITSFANTDNTSISTIFYRPNSQSNEWTYTKLWAEAGTIPGATRLIDIDGTESKLFGATTSGHVIFFDAKGVRRYNGGITSARAHEGDNLGATSLKKLIQGRQINHLRLPVFGCQLCEEI